MMHRTRRIALGFLTVVFIATYAAAYQFLPRRIMRGGASIEHLRIFDRDFQPYFFTPAGAIESLLIRARPTAFWPEACRHVVILQTMGDRDGRTRVQLSFRATHEPPPLYRPIDGNRDIVQEAAAYVDYTGGSEIVSPDGTRHPCRYWDCELEQAEEFLATRYDRPFTILKVIRWYDETVDEQARGHLLRLLAASRDPRGVLIVATASRSTNFEVRFAAAEALRTYLLPHCSSGMNEYMGFDWVSDWMEENSGPLWKAASGLPLN